MAFAIKYRKSMAKAEVINGKINYKSLTETMTTAISIDCTQKKK